MTRHRRVDPEWFDRIRVGSVLKDRNGVMRVVRKVSRWNGRLGCVTFAIRRCSWTGRAYTALCAADLKSRGFTLLPVTVKLNSPLDVRLNTAIHERTTRRKDYAMKCCEAIGLP